ncbi:sugar ABC transporter ATP-binding protein [Paenibacillus eucommiae]|uniref:Ribose transport system ATP-binding protein n=1 Tax=Paenibacillus eucommiae TaxID=1355755 RepID=A0ABS4J2X7_9BACL|nr:sugar ABC transporter ATP-binding protein [Paenibacillus eucommiae]MBP1994192.1 ribose transport system ATP-binding protein [Paenibacillus eucommiae]
MSLLKVKEVDKKFGSHYALSKISLDIQPGEVHALVGENGAGKSTLIKILTGVYPLDGGEIDWKGKRVTITDPNSARRLGINVVHQDRHLIPSFSGYENLYLGLDYPKNRVGFGVDWKSLKQRTEQLKESLGIDLDLKKTATEMSPPERTTLEILRAMMLDCQLLILDEPTASLTDQESEMLFQLIHKLTANGTAILYVSHRMDEIFRLSDRITVFRNGQLAGTLQKAGTDKEALIRLMTNAEVKKSTFQKRFVDDTVPSVLTVSHAATMDGKVKDVSLTVRQGEIVGLFGLAGSGRTELLEAIYGSRPLKRGEVNIENNRLRAFTPRDALNRRVVLIPEDRRGDALIMGMTIRENMTLPVLHQYSNGIKVTESKEKTEVKSWMDFMKVKATGSEQSVQELSGGNQQKVVFAKALLSKPVLFLCDEPTQAVDVMTRDEIHRLLREQTNQESAVLFVSSDLQEVLDIADRIYVQHDGVTLAELVNDGITPEEILNICYQQGKDSEVTHG